MCECAHLELLKSNFFNIQLMRMSSYSRWFDKFILIIGVTTQNLVATKCSLIANTLFVCFYNHKVASEQLEVKASNYFKPVSDNFIET